jgi:hypothetical protein
MRHGDFNVNFVALLEALFKINFKCLAGANFHQQLFKIAAAAFGCKLNIVFFVTITCIILAASIPENPFHAYNF